MIRNHIEKIVQNFASEVTKEIGDHLAEIIWYGSTARGEGTKDSDIDILLLTKEENHDLRKQAVDVSAYLSLQYDCLIAVSLMSVNRFKKMITNGRLYAKNIEQQGIRLWKKPV
jgi:predicted nucleotidyltransferase